MARMGHTVIHRVTCIAGPAVCHSSMHHRHHQCLPAQRQPCQEYSVCEAYARYPRGTIRCYQDSCGVPDGLCSHLQAATLRRDRPPSNEDRELHCVNRVRCRIPVHHPRLVYSARGRKGNHLRHRHQAGLSGGERTSGRLAQGDVRHVSWTSRPARSDSTIPRAVRREVSQGVCAHDGHV